MTPEICPNCGELVPDNAASCPECGADENTGWNDRATGQRLNLPDDEFDYDDFIEEEFGEKQSHPLKVDGISWITWGAGIALTLLFLSRFF
ncbi:MAG: zinc ribbon domain-containing protein [Verrucomicrobiae bacterium]|jgi:hypothetical protein|nr:zinc ribbon domain-containing protein [Verrucomicrobiae bacterium]